MKVRWAPQASPTPAGTAQRLSGNGAWQWEQGPPGEQSPCPGAQDCVEGCLGHVPGVRPGLLCVTPTAGAPTAALPRGSSLPCRKLCAAGSAGTRLVLCPRDILTAHARLPGGEGSLPP